MALSIGSNGPADAACGRGWARSGDLWSGQGEGWRRWMRQRRGRGRGPLKFMAIVATLVLVVTMPMHVERASDPCSALELRVAEELSAPRALPGFGETGRFGRAAAGRRLPWLPSPIGCTAAWWHVVVAPSAAPRWFAAMR